MHVLLRSRGVRFLSHQVVKIRNESDSRNLLEHDSDNLPGDFMSNAIRICKQRTSHVARLDTSPAAPQAVISLSETFVESVEVIIDGPHSTPLVNSVFNPLRFYSNLHRTHQQFFKSFLPSTVDVRVPAFGCIWSSSPSLPSPYVHPRKKCLCLKPPPETELFSPKRRKIRKENSSKKVFFISSFHPAAPFVQL